jgi:glutamate-1-semialdehyde 2,1-aminomutase
MLDRMGATEDTALRSFAGPASPANEAGRAALWRRARAVIPGGVNSPVRAWGAVAAEEPFFVRRGEGAYLEDTDGKRYVDWVQSWGPLVFGHADREVVEAVQEAAADGTTFGAPTEREIELAEEICDAFPSVEKVRLVSSGTEAAMSAVRLARGFTGRGRILKFAGCYHGHGDALIADTDAPVCPFNDADAVAAAVERRGEGLAAIIVEPVAGNMGVVPPAPGFLELLRQLCDASGTMLVFDEVITGFRVARGGAQERYGVRPDLTVLGKIAGGGLPLAAFGGRAELMDRLAPEGPVYQAGTLSGNPLATAAALTVVRRLRDPDVYRHLEETGAALEAGLQHEDVTVQRVGSMLTVFFRRAPVRNVEDARASDLERYGAFFRHLLARGVYVAPSQFEALFVSTVHGPGEIERTVEAAQEFLAGQER